MMSKQWTTGFVLMGTLLLLTTESSAAMREHGSVRFGYR